MEFPCLRESTIRLEQRMTELDRCINNLKLRSSLNLLLYLVGLAQMLAISRSPHITCRFTWMPLLLSLVIFAVSCFYLYRRLRLLWDHSAQMKQVAAELDKDRWRLLELGIYHDAFLAEMAGVWAVPFSATLLWGIVNALCFVFFSVPLIYAQYTHSSAAIEFVRNRLRESYYLVYMSLHVL